MGVPKIWGELIRPSMIKNKSKKDAVLSRFQARTDTVLFVMLDSGTFPQAVPVVQHLCKEGTTFPSIEPCFQEVHLRLGFEGGWCMRKLAEHVKRTIEKTAERNGVVERAPFNISLNLVDKERQSQLAAEKQEEVRALNVVKGYVECLPFTRPAELDLPMLRQIMAQVAGDLTEEINGVTELRDDCEGILGVIVSGDSDIPLWAHAVRNKHREAFWVPCDRIFSRILFGGLNHETWEIEFGFLKDICDEIDARFKPSLPLCMLSSDMFPALPDPDSYVDFDADKQGEIGAEMVHNFIESLSLEDGGDVVKRAMRHWVVFGATTPEDMKRALDAGCNYLVSRAGMTEEDKALDLFNSLLGLPGTHPSLSKWCSRKWGIKGTRQGDSWREALGLWRRQVSDHTGLITTAKTVHPKQFKIMLMGNNPFLIPVPDETYLRETAMCYESMAISLVPYMGTGPPLNIWSVDASLAQYARPDGTYRFEQTSDLNLRMISAEERDNRGLIRWRPDPSSLSWCKSAVEFVLMESSGKAPYEYFHGVFNTAKKPRDSDLIDV